jgi:hypothetical protein
MKIIKRILKKWIAEEGSIHGAQDRVELAAVKTVMKLRCPKYLEFLG